MKICPKCKVEVADDAKFCATCGHAFEATPSVNVTVEKSAEETFDHKPLVMEWYQTSGFAKFLFNVWPKLNVIATLVSFFCMLGGVLIASLAWFNQIPGIENIVPDGLANGVGVSILSLGIGLQLIAFAANMIFRNDLKKFLFASFLKKKGVDLDVAAKYVFFHISVDNFSSIPRKEKGSLDAWLLTPNYFGEAVMIAASSEAKKTNLIWMIVMTAVAFVCQAVQNSVLLTLVGGLFGLDFSGSMGQVGGLFIMLIVFVVVMIGVSIANTIVSTIGLKKRVASKGVWAIKVTNPDVQNVEVISIN